MPLTVTHNETIDRLTRINDLLSQRNAQLIDSLKELVNRYSTMPEEGEHPDSPIGRARAVIALAERPIE